MEKKEVISHIKLEIFKFKHRVAELNKLLEMGKVHPERITEVEKEIKGYENDANKWTQVLNWVKNH